MDVEDQRKILESSLIPKIQKGYDDAYGGEQEKGLWNKVEACKELKKQISLAGPIVVVNLLSFCMQVISVMFVGHLGDLTLSGASMASSFTTVTGFSFLQGMASVLDTLCGQAYGAKKYRKLSIHTQKAIFVLSIFSIPIAYIWAKAGDILLLLGQDPEISAEAGVYSKAMVPSIFAYGILQCLVKFLQSQNIVFPTMITTGFTACLHILTCWILVFKTGLGVKGAAYASVISYWLNVLLLTLYVKFSPSCKETWTGFSKEALHGIPKFLGLAIPSTLMICLEWWSFEIMVLLAGLLPNPVLETSALSISLNTSNIAFMIPLGLGAAISTRVSNELGAGQPRTARLAVTVVVAMAVIEALVMATLLILVHGVWGYLYSNEETIVIYVGKLLLLLAASQILEASQSVFSGIARGCGRQKIGAMINLGSYYLVGIPSGVLLAFVYHLGGQGLWTGNILALFVQAVSLLIVTIRTDWDEEATKAANRVSISALVIEDVLS